jgi:hypothetical protein
MPEREPDGLLPAGPTLIALVWFRRQTSSRGNEYLNCRWGVISGPHKGAGFFSPVGLNTDHVACMRRWEVWMEAVGVTEEVDLDSDAVVRERFLGKGHKVILRAKELNGERVNDIQMVCYPRHYREEDRQAIEAWEREWASRDWKYQDPSDPGHTDRDAPVEQQQTEPQWSEGHRFAEDEDDGDEIPF